MPSEFDMAALEFDNRRQMTAWHLQRLRHIGLTYGLICTTCTAVEFAVGTPSLAWVYVGNSVLIFTLTSMLTADNHVRIERTGLAVVFATCLASVLLAGSPMNFSYLVCVLCNQQYP